jgi:DNA helicase-4
MINNASNVLDDYIKRNELLPYDYIFVDEYQDISLQRFDLCEKLSRASNAKIIAVGDDWQSIFKFAGAKID